MQSVRAAGLKVTGLPQQQGRDERDDQRDAQKIERVAEGQDEGLLLHGLTDRDDPGAGGLFEQGNRLGQHVGMNCSRLVRKVCSTAMPIAPPRLRIMLNSAEAEPAFSLDAGGGDAESGANAQRLADRADHVGPEQLIGPDSRSSCRCS
jgi:hypothetical protein